MMLQPNTELSTRSRSCAGRGGGASVVYHDALLTPGMSPAEAASLNRCCESEKAM